jgi:hypothetical protein
LGCMQSTYQLIYHELLCVYWDWAFENGMWITGFISKFFDTYNFAMVCRYTTVKLLLKSSAWHCINVQNVTLCLLWLEWVFGRFP